MEYIARGITATFLMLIGVLGASIILTLADSPNEKGKDIKKVCHPTSLYWVQHKGTPIRVYDCGDINLK